MKKALILLALFLTGCSIKPAFKHDPLYEKALKHTQRCQIVNSLETKALIDVIYLNPLYPQLKTQAFLIGVYNDFNNTLNNIEFNLTINSKDINYSTKIPHYILYKNFPFYNSWMNYYFVTTNTKAPFKIKYQSKHWGECVINIK